MMWKQNKDLVKDNHKEAKVAFEKAYNKSKISKTFKVGDFVLVHFPPGTGIVGGNKKSLQIGEEFTVSANS